MHKRSIILSRKFGGLASDPVKAAINIVLSEQKSERSHRAKSPSKAEGSGECETEVTSDLFLRTKI